MVLSLKKVFNAASGVLNAAKSVLPLNIGIPRSYINEKNSKYIVEISSLSGPSMFAFLQEKFSFSVTSNWTDSGLMSGVTAGLSDAGQFLTGRTLVSTMATRRKWRGSSPIGIELKLKFEAFESVKKEVLFPCYNLQALALPSRSGEKLGGSSWFLLPPGPNPFYWSGASTVPGSAGFSKGDQIKIVIGGFITFPSVIVNSVNIVFESRMSADGPVGAEATVSFSTYEMFTKNDLLDSYTGMTEKSIVGDENTTETERV